jgi:hypothetical protein
MVEVIVIGGKVVTLPERVIVDAGSVVVVTLVSVVVEVSVVTRSVVMYETSVVRTVSVGPGTEI